MYPIFKLDLSILTIS